MADPYSDVYNALWTLLDEHADFSAIVLPGNRVKLTEQQDMDPEDEQAATADFPEVRITPAGSASVELWKTPNSARDICRWDIGLATGDLRINGEGHLLPVKWQILRALSHAKDPAASLWLGLPRVKALHVEGIAELDANRALNRGTRGWVALIRVTTDLWFTQDELRA